MQTATDVIKIIIYILLGALGMGAIGAFNLIHGNCIIGAVCFIVAGFLLGFLFGFFVANIEDEDESNDLF